MRRDSKEFVRDLKSVFEEMEEFLAHFSEVMDEYPGEKASEALKQSGLFNDREIQGIMSVIEGIYELADWYPIAVLDYFKFIH